MGERNALVLAALVVATIGAVPVAGLAATTDSPVRTNDTNATGASNATTSIAPGERLAGVMTVQRAELQGEIDERSFGISVANATSDRNRADIVNRQLEDIEGRLADLQERKRDLREAREGGEISEGRYRAELSGVAAETETAKRLAERSERVTRGLPTDVLDATDIDVTAIQTLRERADELRGPEVADIAREIAGPNVGRPAAERPEDAGEPEDRPGSEERPGGDGPDGNGTDGSTPEGTTDGRQSGGSDGPRESPRP